MKFPHRRNLRGLTLAIALSLCAFNAGPVMADQVSADKVSDFYSGRRLTFLVGFSPGSAFDVYGRAVSRHFSKFVPGKPDILIQNMPGAGGVSSAAYLYNIAPKDGTMIGVFSRSTPMEPLLGNPSVKFDPTRFTWIGSAGREVSVCVANATAGIQSWDDVTKREFVVGASSLSADTGVFATVLKNAFGAKMRIVTGYPGGNEITQAMENHEIDGRCGWSWSAIESSRPSWVKEGTIKVLLQLGLEPSAKLKDVPLVMDLAKTDRERQILKLVFARQDFAWPFAAPPDVPADRAQALRQAFLATLADPEFLAEAARLSLDVSSPTSGEKLDALIKDIYASPPEVIEQVKAVMNAK
jgi:tripartite-type tricarboxylate transporter receptor subunit TctC